MKMRIGINALSVYSGGGFTSFINLLSALDELDKENDYFVFVSTAQTQIISYVPSKFKKKFVEFNPRILWRRILFEQVILPFKLFTSHIDWLYSVGNITSLLAPCKILLVMENANPYSSLSINRPLRERLRLHALKFLGKLSARRATKIRFLSENSREIICHIQHIPLEKTCIIYHGVHINNRLDPTRENLDIPSKYILCVADIMPHKNIPTLMNAFEIFISKYTYEGYLVIAGAIIDPFYYEFLLKQKEKLSCRQRIIFVGWVDPSKLSTFYEKAEIFVLPSLEETFGMPVIEAMSKGLPVAVSGKVKRDSMYFIPFPELCKDAAVYFDPFDPEDLAVQMNRISSDPQLRASLVASGKARAREFSWLTTAELLSREFSSK